MAKICTTVEQSKKLIELGLDAKTADMSWDSIYDESHLMSDYKMSLVPYKYSSSICVPAWSLSALLDIMPPIDNLKPMIDLEGNSIYYSGHDAPCTEGSTLMDAAFEMICWLLENKKL